MCASGIRQLARTCLIWLEHVAWGSIFACSAKSVLEPLLYGMDWAALVNWQRVLCAVGRVQSSCTDRHSW